MKWVILLSGVASNALASILIKIATEPPYKLPSLYAPYTAIKNWPLMLGVTMYAVALGCYVAALSRLPLNIAHPIMTSGAIALVVLSSTVFFKERFDWLHVIGVGFVVLGVVLISMHANKYL